MFPIETIRTLLPSVSIKSIILDDPDQINDSTSSGAPAVASKRSQQLSVRVKTTSITNLKSNKKRARNTNKDKFFGSRKKIDFSEYLRVCVIQSRNADLTAILQSMGKDILRYIGPMSQWRGNAKFDDMVYSNILKTKAGADKSGVPVFKNSFMKISTKKLFGDIDSPLLEKVDNDGKEIKSIPIDFNFVIDQPNPAHLSYFVVPYIDLESLATEFDSLSSLFSRNDNSRKGGFQLKDFDKISNIPTPLKYDTIFDDGRLSGDSFFYRMPDGKVWTGPVHQMSGGRYMTGNSHGPDSTNLEVVQTKNIKIQDFRNRRGMMSVRVMNDFQDEEATVRNIINNLQPKNRSLNPNNNAKDPYISDLFLSLGSRKSSKFMFLVNMNDLLSHNSVFGKVIKTGRLSLRNKIFQNSKIKSLKIYRDVVKKVIGNNALSGEVDRFLQQERAPVLVVDTFQKEGKSTVEPVGNFVEETNMSFSGVGVRSFNVVDRNFSSADRSQHQYRIELEIVDGTLDYLRNEVLSLQNFIYALKNYESDMLNSIIRPKEESDNPHIKDDARVFSRTRMIGGFDFRFGNLTPNFAIKMKNKYNGVVQSGIDSFIELLKIFSDDENFTVIQETNLKNFLGLITNSNATNPTNISSLIQLLQESVAKISSFLGQNARTTDPTEKKANFVVGFGESIFATHGAIKIEKKFSNIADLSLQGKGAYDYLSISTGMSSQDSSNQVGLKTVGGKQYRERVVREILKYFTTTQPNLTQGMTGAGIKFAGGDSAQGSAFSFFSPSIIRFNELPIDILNAGRAENPLLMKFIESKLVTNKTDSERSGETSVYDVNFRRDSFLASRGNTRTQQIAPVEQQRYLSEYYNFISTLPKVVPLSENQIPSATTGIVNALALFQDASESSLAAIAPTATSQPSSFIEKIFKRTLDESQVSEEKNIESFDLNQQENYLRGVEQFQVAQLPNQVKALFISITTGNGGDVVFRPQLRKNVFEDPDNSAAATLKYKLLAEVQYLDSFFSTSMSNNKRMLMTAPAFKRLTSDAFSKFTGKKILCRLRKFEIPQWGLFRPPLLDALIYDEYFIMTPDSPSIGPNPTETPGGFLGDPTSELIAAQGWGLSEEEYALLSEFGTSFLPNTNASLQSDAMQSLGASMASFQGALFASPAVDNFNTNANAPSNTAGSRATSLGNIPKLRSELKGIRTSITALELEISAKQSLLKTTADKKQIDVNSLSNLSVDEMQSPSAQQVRVRISEYDATIEAATVQLNDRKQKRDSYKVMEAQKLAEIRAEVARVQRAIIFKQVRSGVFEGCELPSQLDSAISAMAIAGATGNPVENFEAIVSGNPPTPADLPPPPVFEEGGDEAEFAAAQQAYEALVQEAASAGSGGSTSDETAGVFQSTENIQDQYRDLISGMIYGDSGIDESGNITYETAGRQTSPDRISAQTLGDFEKFQSYMSPGDAEEFSALMGEVRSTVDVTGYDMGAKISASITSESAVFLSEALEICKSPETLAAERAATTTAATAAGTAAEEAAAATAAAAEAATALNIITQKAFTSIENFLNENGLSPQEAGMDSWTTLISQGILI